MTLPSIIIPDPRGRPVYRHNTEVLREITAQQNDLAPPIENVRFEHDPSWREHPLSLQGAREGRTWIGKIGFVLMLLGEIGWTYWRARYY